MSIKFLDTTTLTVAIDDHTRVLTVASNANMVAGRMIMYDNEIMLITVVPVTPTTRVEVQRGIGGTLQRSHAAHSGLVYIGNAAGNDLGSGFMTLATGEVILSGTPGGSLPFYRRLGERARDGAGNEYVMCDFTAQTYSRQPVTINSDFTAAPVGVTGRGNIGIAAEEATSNQWGWVQIYGRCFVQLGMGDTSPSDAANGPTTLSTSAATIFMLGTSLSSPNGIGWTSVAPGTSGFNTAAWIVDGMVVSDGASVGAVSAVTSAASHTGAQISVFLNYPKLRFVAAYVS